MNTQTRIIATFVWHADSANANSVATTVPPMSQGVRRPREARVRSDIAEANAVMNIATTMPTPISTARFTVPSKAPPNSSSRSGTSTTVSATMANDSSSDAAAKPLFMRNTCVCVGR